MTTGRLCLFVILVTVAALACDSGDEDQGQGSNGSVDASADVRSEAGPGDATPTDGSSNDDLTPSQDTTKDTAALDGEDFDPEVVWVDEAYALIWQRVAPEARMSVEEAIAYCEENQGGLPGLGWRLPNISELRTLVRGCPATAPDGLCGLTESCTDFEACWSTDCWSTCTLGDGPGGCYREPALKSDSCSAAWSSDSVDDQMGRYWYLNFRRAGLHHDIPDVESEVRCVRWLQ